MSFPLTPCSTCPKVTRDLPLPCLAQTNKNEILCGRANVNGPNFRQGYYNLICGETNKSHSQPIQYDQETKGPSQELINKGKFNNLNEIDEHNKKVNNKFKNRLSIINSCKDRSVKKTIKNAQGVSQIIHVITLDDGSELTYSDCGCGMNRCRIGKGNREGYVNFQDCLACVKERGLLPDEPPEKQPGLGDGWEVEKEIP